MTTPPPAPAAGVPPSASDRLLGTLVERLHGRESLEIEFKRARGGLPRDLWPTVSAFANTTGGWILLGVREEEEGEAVIEGLQNPGARLQELNDLLRNPQKISTAVCGAADTTIETLDGRPILVVRIPAAPRQSRMEREGRRFVYRLVGAAAGFSAGPSLQDGAENLLGSEGSLHPSAASLHPNAAGLRPDAASGPAEGLTDGEGSAALKDPSLAAELTAIARPAQGRGRSSPALRDHTIVALCARTPLTRQDLAALLGRSEVFLRRVTAALVRDGRLALRYPDQPTSPRQRYVAGARVDMPNEIVNS